MKRTCPGAKQDQEDAYGDDGADESDSNGLTAWAANAQMAHCLQDKCIEGCGEGRKIVRDEPCFHEHSQGYPSTQRTKNLVRRSARTRCMKNKGESNAMPAKNRIARTIFSGVSVRNPFTVRIF